METKKIRTLIEDLRNVIVNVKELGSDIVNFQKVPVENLEVVIKALKKQLPMKPLEVKNSPIPSEKMYYCPMCNGRFVNRGAVSYCYHCGQALDWSE